MQPLVLGGDGQGVYHRTVAGTPPTVKEEASIRRGLFVRAERVTRSGWNRSYSLIVTEMMLL